MRAVLALALAIPIAIYSQKITGTVVDGDGRPIEGVRIDHISMRYSEIVSDRDGHFSFSFGGPSVVFRKLGYQSQRVHKSPSTDLQIVLQSVPRKEFPVCKTLQGYVSIRDGAAGLYFPIVAGVSADGRGRDIDYETRFYSVTTDTGVKAIQHGRGLMWSFGIPVETDVWQSAEFSETGYAFPGISENTVIILDTRGKTAAGKFWRYLGMFGESASYRGVDEATSHILDQVMDGACLLPQAR